MSTSPESSAAAARRISQRQPQSCTECTRRKTRCDRTVPCNNCKKRGLPQQCQIEVIVPSKSLNNVSQLKQLRAEMVAADAALADRIAGIEDIVRTYLDSQGAVGRLSKRKRTSAELERLVDAGSDEDRVETKDDEAEAAATLEFLAIGRVRQKSPGGIDDAAAWDSGLADADTGDAQAGHVSVPATPGRPARAVSLLRPGAEALAALASAPAYCPDPRLRAYRAAVRHDVLARLPSADVGRALVRYDVEHVSWMHCCYHGPTFQAESDLFWSELGADDVEVNWSFLALLFGVLMSALHHLPTSTAAVLFPSQDTQATMSVWFDACMLVLTEADWMRAHSLYAVQCIAVIVSPANHLGKADLYFTLLGAAVRVAQALNLHRLGPDGYDRRTVRAAVLVAREVRKRVWWQLVIQDSFHVAFNGACSIHESQFDTPPPVHWTDDPLGPDGQVVQLSHDVPTIDSHTCQLLKLALQINRAYTSTAQLRAVPYDTLLEVDAEMQALREQVPAWMRDERAPLPAGAPSWLEWQRRAYIISAAHKVIVLHRPYLGRAFRGDARYTHSRVTCREHALNILQLFTSCALEEFRKTWTVLAHVVAACLVVLLDMSQAADAAAADALRPVRAAVDILRTLGPVSSIARKGVLVLSPLTDTAGPGARAGPRVRAAFAGRAEQELQRALDIFRRPPHTVPTSAPASVSVPVGAAAADDGASAPAPATVAAPAQTQTQTHTPDFAAELGRFPLSPVMDGLHVDDDAFVWMAGWAGDNSEGAGVGEGEGIDEMGYDGVPWV
ncbi:hypothetical protein Q5752_004948 [Cryptotrichosporon argae]